MEIAMKLLLRRVMAWSLLPVFMMIFCACAAGQPSSAVLEQLKRQYVPSTLYDATSGVVTQTGITLAVRRPGISANPAIDDTYTANFYAPHAGAVTQQKQSRNRGGGKRVFDIDNLIVGERVYVTNIDGSDSNVTLSVQTCTPSSQHASYQLVYRASLTFQFPLGYVDITNIKQIEEAIGEVFTVAEPAPPQVSGLFINSRNRAEQLQLNGNGLFSLTEGGRSYTGRFSVHESRLVLMVAETGTSAIATIQGGKILDNDGKTWVQAASAAGGVTLTAGQLASGAGMSDIVHVGQTMNEVKALLGPPDKTEETNGQVVYVYAGLMVTFVNGKVTRVQ
jgi:hypothetical protein